MAKSSGLRKAQTPVQPLAKTVGRSKTKRAEKLLQQFPALTNRTCEVRMAEQSPKLINSCRQCGAPTLRMYCGNACKIRAYRTSSPDKAAGCRKREAENSRLADSFRVRVVVRMNAPVPAPVEPPQPRRCPECAEILPARQHRCDPCRDAKATEAKLKARRLRGRNPSRRAEKARRKALLRGKTQSAEKFDPVEILIRDGWRCHICGVSTSQRLRGTLNDRAPELDHIVPLGVGGQHTRMNTACACRRCNMVKGAKLRGQLRLFA